MEFLSLFTGRIALKLFKGGSNTRQHRTGIVFCNWVLRSSSPGGIGVAYGNGQFVIIGGGGGVARSGVIGKLGASLSPGGQFQGTITGVTGQIYSIETSSSFTGWSALTNVTITNGIGQFTDPSMTNKTRRFYRAMAIIQ